MVAWQGLGCSLLHRKGCRCHELLCCWIRYPTASYLTMLASYAEIHFKHWPVDQRKCRNQSLISILNIIKRHMAVSMYMLIYSVYIKIQTSSLHYLCLRSLSSPHLQPFIHAHFMQNMITPCLRHYNNMPQMHHVKVVVGKKQSWTGIPWCFFETSTTCLQIHYHLT